MHKYTCSSSPLSVESSLLTPAVNGRQRQRGHGGERSTGQNTACQENLGGLS